MKSLSENDYRLYKLLQEAATFAYDKEKGYRFMVSPAESRDLDVIWLIRAIHFDASTPIARIRMDLPAYADVNSNFVNPVWYLTENEVSYFNSFIRQKTENTFDLGDKREFSSVTIFQKAILTLNYEKYYFEPESTYELKYLNYQKKNEGPLPIDLPVPDYSALRQPDFRN
ncbi:MAG: hypothetical protein J6N21_02290 [Butyrivibrio sp.]|nr:hypothetical protein [Butyrivibrio sp.]